jgi:hypothetical protein
MSWSRARRWVGRGLAWAGTGLGSAASAAVGGGLAAATTQGCWGAEFSEGAPQQGPSDASPPETGAGADAADAHVGFCQTETGHQFCDDFDTLPLPSNFMSVATSYGGMVSYDTTVNRSPPNSLLSTLTAALPAGTLSASAFLTKPFTRPGTHLVLQADLKIRGACVVAPSTVAPLGLYFEGYALALYAGTMTTATPAGAQIVEIAVGADGGTTGVPVGHPFKNPLPLDVWFTITIDAQLVTRVINVTVANLTPLSGERLTLEPSTPPQHPTLLVGASLNSTGCAVHVDNVLFDITI